MPVCPVTGLPVTSRPEWTDLLFGNAYHLTFRVIGDRILLNQPSGYAELSDIVESFAVTDVVVDTMIDQSAGYVHISNYAGMRGITHEARKFYVRHMEQRNHLLGLIYFGASPLFRLMIRLARRLSLVKFNVLIVKDYPAAMAAAMQLIGATAKSPVAASGPREPDAEITEHVEGGHHILRCDRWRLALEGFELTAEVIDRHIYHAVSSGTLKARHVAAVAQLREHVRTMIGSDTGFSTIIVNTSGASADRGGRREYIASWREWHRRYPVQRYVFYNSDWFVRTAAKMAAPFMPFKIKAAQDLAGALALVTRYHGDTHRLAGAAAGRKGHGVDPASVVDELLQFIGDMDWERHGASIPERVTRTHPFRPVFDAIVLIKGELDELFEEHRQAEQALRENQQRFEEVLRHSRDIFFKRNLRDNTYEYVSNAIFDLLGYSPEAFLKMGYDGMKSLVHPEDLSRFLTYNQKIVACPDGSTGDHVIEYRIRDSRGNYHWLSDKRTIVCDTDGQPTFVIGNNRDITEQKTAEQEHRASYERFTTVLDSISAQIYVADMQTFEILFMNRAMRSEFGDYQPGDRCYEIFRGAKAPCAQCTTDNLIDDGGKPSGVHTWEGRHPTNGRWYLNHDQAIEWVDGRLVRLQIAMDISRIKALETERLEIAEKLRHTRKLEAVSTMAGGVAHNFNNLLMVVLGNLELLRMMVGEDEELQHKIDAAQKSAQRAADLSSLMLTYVGQTKLSPQTVDLRAALSKMMDVLTATVADRASLSLEPMDTPAWVHADAAKIYQVLTNLINNAVEAAADRPLEIRISIGTQRCDAIQLSRLAPGDALPEGHYVWLRVADNGKGMDQETLEKVFDPFFTTKFTGRGLGMAAVMGIMRAHRGGVRIDSRPDAGTAVTVYFPESEAAAPEQPAAAALPVAEFRGTALLVDDEPLVRELGSQMLHLLGFDVVTAGDGQEALGIFAEHREQIRIALLDVNMPRMGGRETLEHLRALGAAFPVLVTSGYTEAQVMEKMGPARVDGYINKPFRMDQLRAKIEAIFQER